MARIHDVAAERGSEGGGHRRTQLEYVGTSQGRVRGTLIYNVVLQFPKES